jgi:two-component system, NtrC family, sensor histidine kinase HydH
VPTSSRSRPRFAAVRTTSTDVRVVDSLDAGVIVVKAGGSIVRANPCAARILDVSVAELVGRDVATAFAPLPVLLAAARSEKAEGRGELAFVRRDGSRATLGLTMAHFRGDDDVPHHVVLFRDISGVLALRRERDRLLQMAALGDVLPSVLHELRNPLAAATAMLEIMVEETEGELQNDLHALLWELRRMTLNLQGIGGIARPVCGGGQFTAIDHALREACRVLEPTAERKKVRIVCAVDDLPLLPLDRGSISGVVFNLVTNAIDACRVGGAVTVRASSSEGTFTLSVEDNGKGMNPEVLARCCELFFTQKDGGSGIGLALCKEAATSAGGTLDVQSTPGVGTKVTMRVPLDAPSGKKEGGN